MLGNPSKRSTSRSKTVARKFGAAGVALGVLALAFGHSIASAQPQPAPAPQGAPALPPPAAAPPAAGAPGQAAPAGNGAQQGGGASFGLSREVNIPPAQQKTEAESDLGTMNSIRDSVRRQLMESREKHDLVKALCLSDKLTQLDVAISSATDRQVALNSAVEHGNNDLATHEFTIMTVIHQRTNQLQSEANGCLGDGAGSPDDKASVKMTIDKNLTGEDPSDYPTFNQQAGNPPSCVTCYQ